MGTKHACVIFGYNRLPMRLLAHNSSRSTHTTTTTLRAWPTCDEHGAHRDCYCSPYTRYHNRPTCDEHDAHREGSEVESAHIAAFPIVQIWVDRLVQSERPAVI